MSGLGNFFCLKFLRRFHYCTNQQMQRRNYNGDNAICATNDKKRENQVLNSGTLWSFRFKFKEGGVFNFRSGKGFIFETNYKDKLVKNSFVRTLSEGDCLPILVEKTQGFWKISRGKSNFEEIKKVPTSELLMRKFYDEKKVVIQIVYY